MVISDKATATVLRLNFLNVHRFWILEFQFKNDYGVLASSARLERFAIT